MTAGEHPLRPIAPTARQWTWIALAALSTVPGLGTVLGAIPAGDALRALLFGLAIVGASFLISWAAPRWPGRAAEGDGVAVGM